MTATLTAGMPSCRIRSARGVVSSVSPRTMTNGYSADSIAAIRSSAGCGAPVAAIAMTTTAGASRNMSTVSPGVPLDALRPQRPSGCSAVPVRGSSAADIEALRRHELLDVAQADEIEVAPDRVLERGRGRAEL